MAPGQQAVHDHKSEVELIDLWVSPFAMRVRLALAVKGVAYTSIPQNLLGAPRSPLLLQSNPVHKKVPVLLHHDKPICESLTICEYIDEAFPAAALTDSGDVHDLLPKDPFLKAQARFWADFGDKMVFDSLVLKFLCVPKGEFGGMIQDIKGHLRTVEEGGAFAAEAAGPFFAGGEVSFVDVVMAPLVVVLPALQRLLTTYYEEEEEDVFEVKQLPRLQAWLKAIGALPFAHAIFPAPAIQGLVDTIRELRKRRFPHET